MARLSEPQKYYAVVVFKTSARLNVYPHSVWKWCHVQTIRTTDCGYATDLYYEESRKTDGVHAVILDSITLQGLNRVIHETIVDVTSK